MNVHAIFGKRFGWWLLRAALAAIFLYAGLVKLFDPAALALSIVRFQLVPLALVHSIALALPPLELICGCALLVGRWKRQAAFGISAMCTAFLIALISAAFRGLEVDCTCFGSATSVPLWQLIARDVMLLAAAGAIYLQQVRSRSPRADELNATDDCRHSSVPMKTAQR